MKERTFTVTTIKTVRLKIDDSRLSADAVREFSETIFDATADDVVRHAATQVASHGACFVEGIGSAGPFGSGEPVEFDFVVESADVEVAEARAVPEHTEQWWLHRLDMEKTAAWQQGYAQGLHRGATPSPTAPATVKDSLTVETVPWPVVTRYSGGASYEGIGGRVWIRLSDDGAEVEYMPAAPAERVALSDEDVYVLIGVAHWPGMEPGHTGNLLPVAKKIADAIGDRGLAVRCDELIAAHGITPAQGKEKQG